MGEPLTTAGYIHILRVELILHDPATVVKKQTLQMIAERQFVGQYVWDLDVHGAKSRVRG